MVPTTLEKKTHWPSNDLENQVQDQSRWLHWVAPSVSFNFCRGNFCISFVFTEVIHVDELKWNTLYIARIWRNSHARIPSYLQLDDYGWIHVDDKYQFEWFEGQQLPNTIKHVVIDTEATEGKTLPTYMIRYSFKF